MKKIFSHIILSMKTFSHVAISRVIRIQLDTKTWHIQLYNWKMVNSHICLNINVKFWNSGICRV
jgi:hypothetical protein